MFLRTATLVAIAAVLMGASSTKEARADDLIFGGMTYYGPTVAYGFDSGATTTYYGPTTSTGWITGYAPTYPSYTYTPTYTYYAPSTYAPMATTYGGAGNWSGVPAMGYGGGYGYGTAWGYPYRKMEYSQRWSRRGGYKMEYRVR